MSTDQQNHAWRAGPGLVAALTVFGIVTGLGVTEAVGCTGSRPWILAPFTLAASPWWTNPLNCLVSAALLAVVCMATVTRRQVALCLMGIEFAGFVLFLFFLRGGYAVGIIGTPLLPVVQYDALSVAVRVGALGLLVFGQSPSRRRLFTVSVVGVAAALVIVALKATVHPHPIW
jgi:hypothetical protein